MNQNRLFSDPSADPENAKPALPRNPSNLSNPPVQPGDPVFQANPYNPDEPFDLYSQQKEHRSRAHRKKRRQTRRLRQLGLAFIPFICVLAGLVLISIGLCRYLEQDSLLSIFLISRESADRQDWRGDNWGVGGRPTPTPTAAPLLVLPTEAAGETYNGRLVVPFFYIGDQFGTLRIPSVELEVGLFQGDSEAEFRKGAGHYTGSYFPGQNGNILIAGHRTSFFRSFEYLAAGDLVYVETTYGLFTYRIDELRIIDGGDQSVAADTPQEQLTLYTCYPFVYFGNAPQRFVVICSLVESEIYV